MLISNFILSPHYDDAVLSSWAQLGPKTLVIDIFTHAADGPLTAWDMLTQANNHKQRLLERKEEESLVMQALGQEFGCEYIELDIARNQVNAQEIALMLKEIIPIGSRVYAPVGIGAHKAHILTSDAAAQLGDYDVVFYADMPYALQYGLEVKAYCDPFAYWRHRLDQIKGLGQMQEISVDIKKKIEFAKMYKTQFSTLDASIGGRLEEGLAKEFYWPLNPSIY